MFPVYAHLPEKKRKEKKRKESSSINSSLVSSQTILSLTKFIQKYISIEPNHIEFDQVYTEIYQCS